MTDKCKCSFRIKMVGDGCRYCNPQYYIDILEDQAADDERRIKELEDGSCRFNCRSVKEAFHAGYLAAQCGENSLEAYKRWRGRE